MVDAVMPPVPVFFGCCCRAVAYWLGWSPHTFYKMVSSSMSHDIIDATEVVCFE
jgi:hypothetical protein